MAFTRIEAVSNKVQKLAQISKFEFEAPASSNSRQSTLIPQPDCEDDARLPCVVLPVHRNSRFFGRKTELEKIDQYLGAKDVAGLRSLAIHGLGGVGKTQTALAYAYSKVGDFDAVIWLAAETEIALSSSLGEAAHHLSLPQSEVGHSINNVQLVMKWLQTTGMTS